MGGCAVGRFGVDFEDGKGCGIDEANTEQYSASLRSPA